MNSTEEFFGHCATILDEDECNNDQSDKCTWNEGQCDKKEGFYTEGASDKGASDKKEGFYCLLVLYKKPSAKRQWYQIKFPNSTVEMPQNTSRHDIDS